MPKLTSKAIESLSTPGRYAGGDGLYIEVTDTGSKRWLFRYQFRGKRTQLGLGAFSKSNSFQMASPLMRSDPPDAMFFQRYFADGVNIEFKF